MRIVSVNQCLSQTVEWNGKSVTTGIFKTPVSEPVSVDANGLRGDEQADLSVHGGIDKAVYAFPHEHYKHFAQLLGRDVDDFPCGQFGENLSTEGLLENEVMIGDRFRIGDSAEFEVSQPRTPCFKLGIIMQDPKFLRPFLKSLKTGFYLRVVKNGTIQAGDSIHQVHSESPSLSVADITRLNSFDRDHYDDLRKATQLTALTQSWRDDFNKQLDPS
jgi:MOSC domain-containing protein YiiM